MEALLRVVALERSRAAARCAPGAAPDITSIACYSKVFGRLIDRCVALRPLLSRIKEAYDDAANGQIHHLQAGAAKLTRARTGVDRLAGLDALGLLATSENPSDGRFAAEQEALQTSLDRTRRRAELAQEAAAQKRATLDAKRRELADLKQSCRSLTDTVEALRSTQNRVVASLRQIATRRVGDDENHKSGYWLKRESTDTRAKTNETRGLIRREQLEREQTNEELERVDGRVEQLAEDCDDIEEEIEKWEADIVDLRKRTENTEESFKDYKRSVGPGTPRPDWEQVETELMHGSFGENVTVNGNEELALYRRTYGTNPLHLDVEQASATLAVEIAEHVCELRVHLVETERQLQDALKIKEKKQQEEKELQAVIEAEQAAVAESYQTKKYFVLEGTRPSVPIYMRGTGKVRDLIMPKAEAEQIIQNVWDTKIRSDSRKGAKKLELAEFFAGWVKTAYGVRALEKTYNLLDALKRFEYDADCALFYLVLKGELSEQVYVEEGRMIDSFMHSLVDEARRHSNPGTLNKKLRRPEFLATLESHFANKKTPDELYSLKRALAYDQAGPYINYNDLLEENERADQGQFAEELRDQFLLSVQQSYIAIEHSIREATIKRASTNGRTIPTDGPPRIAAHRVIFATASCTQRCDTLMKESLLIECPLVQYLLR